MRYRRLLLALILGLTACSKRPAPGPVRAQEPGELAVIVESQYSGMVTVYLDAGGRSIRLGEIHFQETSSYVVPWRSVGDGGDIRLRGEVIGSKEQSVTPPVRARPGSVVRWTLTPRLSMSYYAIY